MSTPKFNHKTLERFVILLGEGLFRTYSLGDNPAREMERLKLAIAEKYDELPPDDVQQLLRLADIFGQFRQREGKIPETRLDDIRATYLTNENAQDPQSRSV